MKRTTAAGQPNAMHSADSVEHFTPGYIVEAARATLGEIDLDPASCELANRTVRASVYYTRFDDGLSRHWAMMLETGQPARVFCNPPGGKDGGESVQKQWWRHSAREWLAGRVDALVWVTFKVDFLQVTQVDRDDGDALFGGGRPPIPLDGAICYPRERIAYMTPRLPEEPTARQRRDHELTGLCTGTSPPHASAIVYLPSRQDPRGLYRFREAFSPIGEVRWDNNYVGALMAGKEPSR